MPFVQGLDSYIAIRVKAGHKEVQVLNKLKQADPEDKRHIVRLERTFEHRGHLCLVFESLR
jgi:serine/threonine-protein kinase PRP4